MRGRKSTKKARATPATIPARYYAIFTDLLRQMGVDIEPLLRAARIDESVLNDGDGLLTPAQVDALIAESAERAGRDDLGFELGRVIKLSSHDILGYGLLASPTLDYALDLGARYYRLISPLFSMAYTRGERHTEIALRPALAMKPQTLYFHLEAGAVSLFEQIQALVGRPMLGLDDRHEVDLGEKPPQRGVGVVGRRLELVDDDRVPRLPVDPLLVRVVAHETVDRSAGVAAKNSAV